MDIATAKFSGFLISFCMGKAPLVVREGSTAQPPERLLVISLSVLIAVAGDNVKACKD